MKGFMAFARLALIGASAWQASHGRFDLATYQVAFAIYLAVRFRE